MKKRTICPNCNKRTMRLNFTLTQTNSQGDERKEGHYKCVECGMQALRVRKAENSTK